MKPKDMMPEDMDPFSPRSVLVVIPAFNEALHIQRCIHSLRQSDPFMQDVLIVVADGGSTDGTRDIVADLARNDPALQWMDNPAQLQSAGVNTAVEHFATPQHRFLVRCDAHAAYPPGYVRKVVTALAQRPEAAAVGTVMDAVTDTATGAVGQRGFQRACAWIIDTRLGSGGSPHRGGGKSQWVDHAHHAGFRLHWFRKIGGYDPGFSQNEDAEFDHRLRRAGGKIWLEADIRLAYFVRPTPYALLMQYWKYGQGRARTTLKHKTMPRMRQLIPVFNVIGLLACLILAPFWSPAWLWPMSYTLLLLLTSIVAVAKLVRISGIWAGPALGLIHTAWGAGFLRGLWTYSKVYK